MRLQAEQLAVALKKKLAPVYLISGDEPMRLGEASDAVRQAAKQAGFVNREILTVDSQFSWSELSVATDSLSLFADKKIIDLRLPSGKPGQEGSKALLDYCQRLSDANLLLISAGKIDRSAQKSRWFQVLEKTGVVVQVWPQEGQDLIQWLQKRSQKKAMSVDREGLQFLARQTEGNLLAAAQEIEKLYVLYGTEKISAKMIAGVIMDNARYDVFKLVDSLLAGQVARSVRILRSLQAEGIAEAVVLWALTRQTRLLLLIKQQLAQGQDRERVFKRCNIWDKRKNRVNQALSRLKSDELQTILLWAQKADRQIKGVQKGDAWETLLYICLLFASGVVLPEARVQKVLLKE